MKVRNIFVALFLCLPLLELSSQVYLEEGFEGGEKPDSWTQEYMNGAVDWRYRNGGYNPSDPNLDDPITPNGEVDIARNPPGAYEGSYNAFFFNQGVNNERTKLITPELNMLGAAAVELTFYLCQIPWTFEGSTGWDILRVYYKVSDSDPWVLLQEYLDPVYSWTEQKLTLPNPSETYYVAFEGHARWGFGTLVDDVTIQETASQQLYVEDIVFDHPFSMDVPSGSSDVPVLRADVLVYGNTGSLSLDQITYTSLNSSDSDLDPGGIKLYRTATQDFVSDSLLGAPTSFSNGTATFTSLNYSLSPGHNYIWLACDVAMDAGHKNRLDAMIRANHIVTSGGNHPVSDQSPPGDRTINHTYFYDDFEGSLNWTLSGEFQVDTPSGNGGNPGNPDPEGAHSGIRALGSDLTGLGSNPFNYEPDLTEEGGDFAASENMNLLYYKDLNLFFRRHLNIEVWDRASIELSTDDGGTWNPVWESNAFINDFKWTQQKLPIPGEYWRSEQLRIRFNLGPTNWKDNYSGWNIDDVFLTGEFISKDVGVSDWIYPQSGSGHTSSDSVTVTIRNYGGSPITDAIPVAYSFNGGDTWTIDNLNTDIPVGDSVVFTFPSRADLSVPGLRPSVIARTLLPGDQFTSNDQFSTEVYIVPTFIPPYSEDFEENDGFWRSLGNIWEFGTPAGGTIDEAASGTKSWMTGLSSTYGEMLSDINQIIFEDGFETVLAWSFTEEFERAIPDGIHLPWNSFEGYFCIGTDLGGGDGDSLHQYENGITPASSYTATSPAIDLTDFSNVELSFASFITIHDGDSLRLEISDNNGSTWHTLWQNNGAEIMDTWWHEDLHSIPDSLTFTNEFRLRFSMYYSSASGEVAEGWNIDKVLLTGNRVSTGQAHLSSPSLNLTWVQNPMITANLWFETEAGTDGVYLQYSLDDGDNWTTVSNSSGKDSYWNWYTGQPVTALSDNGWSGASMHWIPVKHLLPASLGGESNVQFRFSFASDKADNQYDGIAMDDVQVIDAPHDADLLAIASPLNSCELSSEQRFTLTIRNSGLSTINAGDSLRIGYYIEDPEGIQTAEEVYYMPQSLGVGSSMDFTTGSEFDFSSSGEYSAMIYLQYDNPYFYSPVSTDTVSSTILVNKPYVELGNLISTSQPDTVVLKAYSGTAGQTYLWQDSSTDSLFQVNTNGKYWVRVSNGMGCSASDTVRVLQLFPDVGVVAYHGPESGCEADPGLPLEITIRNLGNDTLDAGNRIIMGGIINGGGSFYDTVTLIQAFRPAEQFNHIYSGSFDFSTPGTYPLRLFTQMDQDENQENDTLFYNLEVYGYPDARLGEDTAVDAMEYLLTPETGHSTYLWQDGSSGESYTVDKPGTGLYHVTITNDKLCSSSDTIEVSLNVTDLEMSQLLSPSSACEFSTSLSISAMVGNRGNQTLPAGQDISLGYTINQGTVTAEQTTLASDLQPGDSFNFTFSGEETFEPDQWYLFTVFVDYGDDVNLGNDTISSLVRVFESSPLDLGADRVETGLQYTLDAGPDFVSYLWQDSSANQTFTITSPGIGIYHVTVDDLNGCTLSDTVRIMLSVPDLGVTEILQPQTSCQLGKKEHLQVAVRNHGNWTLAPSSMVYVSYSVNGALEVTEPLVLQDSLKNGDVIYHTFSKEEDFSVPGAYNIVAYTIFDDDLFPANDESSVSIDHHGPFLEIRNDPIWDLEGDSLLVYGPETLYVNQPYSSFEHEWHNGSTANEFEISQPSAAWIWVKAEGDQGCIGYDSLYVAYDRPDLVLQEISPQSGCGYKAETAVSLEVLNNGFSSLSVGDTIRLIYTVNEGSSVIEIFVLSEEHPWGESRNYVFDQTYDFSELGTYQVQASLIYIPDQNMGNNTLITSVEHWEAPVVDIAQGRDTIREELPVSLDAGSGFESYLWSDNSTSQVLDAGSYGLFWVLVTDSRGCTASDSVLITFMSSAGKDLLRSGLIKIYPNPAGEELHVELGLPNLEKVNLELYSISNSLIYKKEMDRWPAKGTTLDVSRLSPGPYILSIMAGKERYSFVVIKD